MKIAFASDHRGYKLKIDLLRKVEKEMNIECIDCGCDNEERCDFPVYAFKACELVKDNTCDYAVVVCGSGDGVCIASNKVKGIRCTLTVSESDASRAKAHMNVNAVALGSEKTDLEEAFKIIRALVETEFLGERHTDRIQMIVDYENKN